ncbi:MAG: TIGR00269 family protein [Nitrosopumilales archaeon CG15_BIG_FIL_POST_REV_8_21_14_020_33_23]|nr:MAG: TIGR00269 family protein [Nitrosopumilales archaeon CG15_BIG_FIL_POST_REV_8_21_14_020_33_23]PIY90362.1 MAG: TIGR00269 family protein [Nitrosopumilales archaeon CG_4_10_14_0_8_um_filter_34_8]PJB97905.1 MAG: TIGR00269 family protein [Nitrosopumilales archaeon CG_4_9_14_0_8_um_filter_34_10]
MKCDRCENQAAYTRKYSGEKLCSKCFSSSIVRKTAKTISKHNMIQNNELVAVAVSGGKDSLALLDIINQMTKTHNFRIKAITIDEGIPGYRNEALEIVQEYCAKLNVEHKVFSYKELFDLTLEEALDLRESEKTSSCSICGTLRRRAIDHAAKDIGADVIATGHNLDDTLQTFVINMLSGDTTKIGWMDPDNSSNTLRKIKPFCEIYESEIVFYAFTNDIPFQTEPCPHMNEGIRTEIREFLNSLEGKHSGIKNNLYQSIIKVSQSVKDGNNKQKTICIKCGNDCTGKICSVCNMVLKLKENQT